MTGFKTTWAKDRSDINGFRKDGFDLAVKHIKAQQPIWVNTEIHPGHLLDLILNNLAALRETIK